MTRTSRWQRLRTPLVLLTGLLAVIATAADESPKSLQQLTGKYCPECVATMASKTGVYILEKGEEALIGRAWLTQHATTSIDVQYFIWSTDNIGTLAAEQLLLAAERGVRVRVLVDDLLVDAQEKTLLLLSAHPNAEIRIYNPNLSVGVSLWRRIVNSTTRFRDVNQRMHDKTAIFDGIAGITGGRNMADEYFDYDHDYNFRDRDVLLLGVAVADMTENFEEFWTSPLAVPVEQIFDDPDYHLSPAAIRQGSDALHRYARNPDNFEPQVREAIANIEASFPALLGAMSWDDVTFISDIPGKNAGRDGLGGGGESTSKLADAVRSARESVLIQSPYLIMPEGGIELLAALEKQGVRVRISTNSLASTDNVPAFSGYHKQRRQLLDAGVELFEFKPHPAIQSELLERYPRLADNAPVFALHAKSMVVDGKVIYIGTFNLDPRSANLNTEVGVLVDSAELARQLTASIERDIAPENSWQTTRDFSPDSEVGRLKRVRMWFDRLLPMDPVL